MEFETLERSSKINNWLEECAIGTQKDIYKTPLSFNLSWPSLQIGDLGVAQIKVTEGARRVQMPWTGTPAYLRYRSGCNTNEDRPFFVDVSVVALKLSPICRSTRSQTFGLSAFFCTSCARLDSPSGVCKTARWYSKSH